MFGSSFAENWAAVAFPVCSQLFSFRRLPSREQLPSTMRAELVGLLVVGHIRLGLVPVCYIWLVEIHPRPLCPGAFTRPGALKLRAVGEFPLSAGAALLCLMIHYNMASGCGVQRDPSSGACVRRRKHCVSRQFKLRLRTRLRRPSTTSAATAALVSPAFSSASGHAISSALVGPCADGARWGAPSVGQWCAFVSFVHPMRSVPRH